MSQEESNSESGEYPGSPGRCHEAAYQLKLPIAGQTDHA